MLQSPRKEVEEDEYGMVIEWVRKETNRGGFPAQEAQVRMVRPLMHDLCFGSLSVVAEEEGWGKGTVWAMVGGDEIELKLLRLVRKGWRLVSQCYDWT